MSWAMHDAAQFPNFATNNVRNLFIWFKQIKPMLFLHGREQRPAQEVPGQGRGKGRGKRKGRVRGCGWGWGREAVLLPECPLYSGVHCTGG